MEGGIIPRVAVRRGEASRPVPRPERWSGNHPLALMRTENLRESYRRGLPPCPFQGVVSENLPGYSLDFPGGLYKWVVQEGKGAKVS